MSLLLKNARVPIVSLPEGMCPDLDEDLKLNPAILCDVKINGRQIESVELAGTENNRGENKTEDLNGNILLPGMIDAHTHLDKTHSWERAPNKSGTFDEALQNLHEDKVYWTEEDVYKRASFALETAWAQGTAALRTHLDINSTNDLHRIKAINRLKAEWKGRIEIEWVPLCNISIFTEPGARELAEFCVGNGSYTLGGMPLMNTNLEVQYDALIKLATEHGVGLDLHVDENGDVNAACLKTIAEAVIRNDFKHPVACGHCCSLATHCLDEQKETLDLVKKAGVHVISLPLCNLYLMDRRIGKGMDIQTPYWRGVTLLHEFMEQGTTLACASDNVRDSFYAYGDYDMLEVFVQSLRIGHLDSRLADALNVVTTGPATVMGLKNYGRIAPGYVSQLIITEAKSFSQLLSRRPNRKRVSGEEVLKLELPDFEDLEVNTVEKLLI